MTAREPAGRGSRRRVVCSGAVAVAIAGSVVVVGAARAALLVAGAGLCLVIVWLPRMEARVFGSAPRAGALVRPEVIGVDAHQPVSGRGLGVEGHRAYAQALHAVTAAYLAECEREAGR